MNIIKNKIVVGLLAVAVAIGGFLISPFSGSTAEFIYSDYISSFSGSGQVYDVGIDSGASFVSWIGKSGATQRHQDVRFTNLIPNAQVITFVIDPKRISAATGSYYGTSLPFSIRLRADIEEGSATFITSSTSGSYAHSASGPNWTFSLRPTSETLTIRLRNPNPSSIPTATGYMTFQSVSIDVGVGFENTGHDASWLQETWTGGENPGVVSNLSPWTQYDSKENSDIVASDRVHLAGFLPEVDCSGTAIPVSGDWTVTGGTVTSGTYCVTGDFTLNGNVSLTGGDTFIVKATNIDINGTLDASAIASGPSANQGKNGTLAPGSSHFAGGGGGGGHTVNGTKSGTYGGAGGSARGSDSDDTISGGVLSGARGGGGRNGVNGSGGSGGLGGGAIGFFSETISFQNNSSILADGDTGNPGGIASPILGGSGGGGGGGGSGGTIFLASRQYSFGSNIVLDVRNGQGGAGGPGNIFPTVNCWDNGSYEGWPPAWVEDIQCDPYDQPLPGGGSGGRGSGGRVKIYHVESLSGYDPTFVITGTGGSATIDQRIADAQGWLVSSPINTGFDQSSWKDMTWTQHTDSSYLSLELRSAADQTSLASTPWVGATGVGTVFDATTCPFNAVSGAGTCSSLPASISDWDSNQWFQYRVNLDTLDVGFPVLDDISFNYKTNQGPVNLDPGGVTDSVLAGDDFVLSSIPIFDPEGDALEYEVLGLDPADGAVDVDFGADTITVSSLGANTNVSFILRFFDIDPDTGTRYGGTSLADIVFDLTVINTSPAISADSTQKATHPPFPVDFIISSSDPDGHSISSYEIDMVAGIRREGQFRYKLDPADAWTDCPDALLNQYCSIAAAGDESITIRYVPIHDTSIATFDEWGVFGMGTASDSPAIFWDQFSIRSQDQYGAWSSDLFMDVGLDNTRPSAPPNLTTTIPTVAPGDFAVFKTNTIPWPDSDIGPSTLPWSLNEPIFWVLDDTDADSLEAGGVGIFASRRGYLGEDIVFSVDSNVATPTSFNNIQYTFVDPWHESLSSGTLSATIEASTPEVLGFIQSLDPTVGNFCEASRSGVNAQYGYTFSYSDPDGNAASLVFQVAIAGNYGNPASLHVDKTIPVQGPTGPISGNLPATADLRGSDSARLPNQLDYGPTYQWRAGVIDADVQNGTQSIQWYESDNPGVDNLITPPAHPYPRVFFEWSPAVVNLNTNGQKAVVDIIFDDLGLVSFVNEADPNSPQNEIKFDWSDPIPQSFPTVAIPSDIERPKDRSCNPGFAHSSIPTGEGYRHDIGNTLPNTCLVNNSFLKVAFEDKDQYDVTLYAVDLNDNACQYTATVGVKPALPTFNESGSR